MKYSNPDLKCVICFKTGVDLHHLRSRGSGGTDHAFNLCPLCRRCHTEIHKIGIVRMATKYPNLEKWLINSGWVLDNVLGKLKWFHPHYQIQTLSKPF